jgi:hypothetical protein
MLAVILGLVDTISLTAALSNCSRLLEELRQLHRELVELQFGP